MRQRERIARVAAEIAEKSGLDPRSKEAIDSVLPHIDKKSLPLEALEKKPAQEEKEDNQKEDDTKSLSPVKKKNPFPPKKKKLSEVVEDKTASSTDE